MQTLATLETWRFGALIVLGIAAGLVFAVVLAEHFFASQRHLLRRLRSLHELGTRWLFGTGLVLVAVGVTLACLAIVGVATGSTVWIAAIVLVVGVVVFGEGGRRVILRADPLAAPELVKAVLLDRIKPAELTRDYPFGMERLATPPTLRFRKRRTGNRLVIVGVLLLGLVLAGALLGMVPLERGLGWLSGALDALPTTVGALLAGVTLSLGVALELGNRRYVLLPPGVHALLAYVVFPGLALAFTVATGASWTAIWVVGLAWVGFTATSRMIWLLEEQRAVERYKVERAISSILDEEDDAVRATWRVFGNESEGIQTEFELESALATLAGREWLSAGAGEIGSVAYRVSGMNIETFELRVRTVRRVLTSSNDGALDPWRLPYQGPLDWSGGATRTVREFEEPIQATLVTEWDEFAGWQAAPPVRDVRPLRRGLAAVADAGIVHDMKIGSAVHPEPDEATDAFIKLATRIHTHRREIATFFSSASVGARLSDVELRALRFPLYSLIPEGKEDPTVWVTSWRGVEALRLPISWPALAVFALMPTLLAAFSVWIVATAVALLF